MPLGVRTRAMRRAYEEEQRILRDIALMERSLVLMKKKAKEFLQYALKSEYDDSESEDDDSDKWFIICEQ